MAQLALEAELLVSRNQTHFAVVAQGNQVVVSFRNLADLESLTSADKEPSKDRSEKKQGSGLAGGLQLLETVNETVRALGLTVKIVVAGKTYLELGGKSYRITMAAVFGKLGSFLKGK